MNIPTLLRCLGFALICFSFGSVRAELPGVNGGTPIKVIDMHTHMFNARDLPLRGVLEALGVRSPVSDVLAEIFLMLTPESNRSSFVSATDLKASVDRPSVVLTLRQKAVLTEYVGLKPESARMLGVSEDTDLVARALEKAGFPPPEGHGDSTGVSLVNSDSPGIAGYLRFLGLTTKSHDEIATFLTQVAYPQTDLFVGHMMDMEKPYNDHPANPFSKQIHQVQETDAKFGKLAHFVAFDPFRHADALPLAQAGIAAGAIGIKFYPPSGYRATDNFFPRNPVGFRGGNEVAGIAGIKIGGIRGSSIR